MDKVGWIIVASMGLLASAALSQTPEQKDGGRNVQDEAGNSSTQTELGASVESGSASHRATTTPPIIMLLVPTQMQRQSESALADGCWTRLYHQLDLQGDSLTLVGPVEMRRMAGPFGMSWSEKLHSLHAGPRATVTVYDGENFQGRSMSVQAGTQVNDLDLKLGRYEEVNSIRIDCARSEE